LKLDLKIRTDFGFIDGNLTEIKKLTATGRGFVITIPKLWVKLFCKPRSDGTYWVAYSQEENTITINGFKEEQDDRHQNY
jgi:hypothetical protein